MEGKRVLIVGGGFAGVATALAISRKRLPETTVTLISDKPHFEYHAALYRLVTGSSPLEVCIPLAEIFSGKNIEMVGDRINSARMRRTSRHRFFRSPLSLRLPRACARKRDKLFQYPGTERVFARNEICHRGAKPETARY